MNLKRILPISGAFLGILILILDGKTALLGAQMGIELCMKTVIPALFPFFVLSILLTSTLMDAHLPLLNTLCSVLGIPKGCEAVLITGLLGGYPAGAQSVAQLYQSRYLSKATAERLLSFCNNAGPSFLFGIIGPMFSERKMVWALWMVHICGAVFAAAITRLPYNENNDTPQHAVASISESVQGAIHAMATVCAWIVLFRILITFLDRWFLWLLPIPVKIALTGLLELSNGCVELSQIENVKLRFLLCSAMLGAGGLCVTMQTSSVTEGLSLKYYLLGKAAQVVFSLAFSLFLVYDMWIPFVVILGTLIVYLAKKQKMSSICSPDGV